MDESKVLNLSVTKDLGIHLWIDLAHSSGNEKLLKFVTENQEILKSIMKKDLFGKLDKKEKLTVGHFIQLHDSESKNMTCNHLPSRISKNRTFNMRKLCPKSRSLHD